MVFCAYCGKSFTRKEHLERHIPSHTNVKPHRCGACQLSFARRDLLQRHHSTYHEARDPIDTLPAGIATVTGRTPIACQNCANAKTGCDKRVPCSRCAEKNLPCAARFARRSSKAAVRAAQASAAFRSALAQNAAPLPPQPQTINPSFMDVDSDPLKSDPLKSDPPKPDPCTSPPLALDGAVVVGGGLHAHAHSQPGSSPKRSSPPHSHRSPGDFPSPHGRADGLDDLMHLGTDFPPHESSYQDLLAWPEYPIDPDMYTSSLPLAARNDLSMPTFNELSDASAASEPMTSTSSRGGSVHTRGTSIMSSSDFDTQLKRADLSSMATPTDSSIPEFKVVLAAEGGWNLARCDPPTLAGSCPRNAIVHLECPCCGYKM